MLADRQKLIFGDNPPADLDFDDEDELHELLRDALPPADDELSEIVMVVAARQILDEDPPYVWATAQRLLGQGLDRVSVLRQLSLALLPTLESALGESQPEGDGPVDLEVRLRELPLPPPEAIRSAAVTTLMTADRDVTADDLDEWLLGEFGEGAESTYLLERLIDTVLDDMHDSGELAYLPGDYVVAPTLLFQGITLTTRKTTPEEWPPLDTDLVGLAATGSLVGELPPGVTPGQLVAVRGRRGGANIEPLPEPEILDWQINEIRRAYDEEIGEAGLPVSFEDLLLNVVAHGDMDFDKPQPPLSDLVTAAGLEVRGELIAHDASVWRESRRSRGTFRIVAASEQEQDREAALEVWRLFEAVTDGEPASPIAMSDLRHALDLMADFKVLLLVADPLFWDTDPEAVEEAAVFVGRLAAAASRPLQRGVAGWLSARVAERRGEPLAAADALADAFRQAPEYAPVIDRLAWTRSDQGRAADAAELWRQLDFPNNPDLIAVEAALAASTNPAAAGLRRNDPCWCGSGRKFKVCHLRVTELPPLPDRMNWMLRKTVAYLDRRGAPVDQLIDDVAWQLADEREEQLDEAHGDPLVLDVVLHELGWFDRFLAERGPLLPEDEQLLYASWQLVPRTLYEIVEIQPDAHIALRDLRTGDVVDVVDHALSRTASQGQVLCARAVPDGRAHQIIGGVFGVRPGDEQTLLEILDEPNPDAAAHRLLAYRAALTRPPELRTTEGEPLRLCTLTLEIDDPAEAGAVLDRLYTVVEPGLWQERASADRELIRATIFLDESALTVETMSEERVDRVKSELSKALPGARIVSDVRREMDREAGPLDEEGTFGEPSEPLPAAVKESLAQFMAAQEERWCREPVPALGGLTPQEAVADPTRREEVIRLIGSFPAGGAVDDSGIMLMRPARLRELLGID